MTGAASSSTRSANINIIGEQRTRRVETLRNADITPVRENTQVPVGLPLPTSVTQLVDFPQMLLRIVRGINNCQVVLVSDRYHIVECRSRRVVTVTER